MNFPKKQQNGHHHQDKCCLTPADEYSWRAPQDGKRKGVVQHAKPKHTDIGCRRQYVANAINEPKQRSLGVGKIDIGCHAFHPCLAAGEKPCRIGTVRTQMGQKGVRRKKSHQEKREKKKAYPVKNCKPTGGGSCRLFIKTLYYLKTVMHHSLFRTNAASTRCKSSKMFWKPHIPKPIIDSRHSDHSLDSLNSWLIEKTQAYLAHSLDSLDKSTRAHFI